VVATQADAAAGLPEVQESAMANAAEGEGRLVPLIKNKTYRFYVYALFSADTPDVFCYVGRTIHPKNRLALHNRKRKENGLPTVKGIVLNSTDTNEKCSVMERHYINKYLGEGHPLSNRNHKAHECWPGCPAFEDGSLVPDSGLHNLLQCTAIMKWPARRCTRPAYENGRCRMHIGKLFTD
jgi:hypothetical protein